VWHAPPTLSGVEILAQVNGSLPKDTDTWFSVQDTTMDSDKGVNMLDL